MQATELSLKEDLSMNIKTSVVKSAIGAGVISAALAAYAFQPVQEVEPVNIIPPFKIESIDIKNSKAAVETLDGKYVVEFAFNADYSNHKNGVGGNWNEVDVIEVKEPSVYDENGEVDNYHIDSRDVQEIALLLEQELRERI